VGLAGIGRDVVRSIGILAVKSRGIVVKLPDLVGYSNLQIVKTGCSTLELSSFNQDGAEVRTRERNEQRGVRNKRA
jgi:hypothetical protein